MSVALIFPFVRPVCIHCDISIDFKADSGVACLTVSFRVEVKPHLLHAITAEPQSTPNPRPPRSWTDLLCINSDQDGWGWRQRMDGQRLVGEP